MLDNAAKNRTLVVDEEQFSLEQIIEVARGRAWITISPDEAFRTHLQKSQKILLDAMTDGIPVYGVTTGFGKCCGKRMVRDVAIQNGLNLIRFHGCGTGESIHPLQVRAAMVTRILCFARGYSGVSVNLLESLAAFLNHDIVPVIPSEGSVGASGDLTPMSYVAATLMGEREVFYQGKQMPAMVALEKAGLSPYRFEPKEPLAIMNGTAIMTGMAVMITERAERILNAAIYATALSIHGLMGNAHHYHPAISKAKPHPGQILVADRILRLLTSTEEPALFESKALETLQDPYSIRCTPQVAGVLHDTLKWSREWIGIEANSANDNPLFDPETGQVVMGGNFYGGHIASAMDSLKAALASIADMSDRQVAVLVDANVNRGLPSDLVRLTGDDRLFNHGFKAMSISSSALAAEALKLTMPAASFSRSTESHNQDKVSMGTIAARDADRICRLVERVVAIHLLAAVQACEIRGGISARPGLDETVKRLRDVAPPLFEDRPMDQDIEAVVRVISGSDLFEMIHA
ncbi:MAG: aromatic amino acid lyase [Desulfobacteraceae bacterium]|nr:MAG: aromatic amino acid lyase [Desulfobacteraceae bacterium]